MFSCLNDLVYSNPLLAPYVDGVDLLSEAVSAQSKALKMNEKRKTYEYRPFGIRDRLQSAALGFLLLVPVVNYVALGVMEWMSSWGGQAKQQKGGGRTGHIGAGVLPYCLRRGKVYFLMGREGGSVATGTLSDFGGAKDSGETARQTAARECWEEGRNFLGTRRKIQDRISCSSPSSGQYAMFLMEIPDSDDLRAKFKQRTFCLGRRMEKSEVVLAKAKHVFASADAGSRGGNNQIQVNGKTYTLRGCFAKTLHRCGEHLRKELQRLSPGGAALASRAALVPVGAV